MIGEHNLGWLSVDHQLVDPEEDIIKPTLARRLPMQRIVPESDRLSRLSAEHGIHRQLGGYKGDELFETYPPSFLDQLADRRWRMALRALQSRGIRELWLAQPQPRRSRRSCHPRTDASDRPRQHLNRAYFDQFPHALWRPTWTGLGRRGLDGERQSGLAVTGWSQIDDEWTERVEVESRVRFFSPFEDPALTSLMMAIPNHLRTIGDDTRGLQRRAFAPVLPPEIRNRRGKVHFDYRHALDLGHPWVVDLARSMHLEREGIIDGDSLRTTMSMLSRIATERPEDLPAGASRVWTILLIEVWLRHL